MLAIGSIFAHRAPKDGKDGLPGAPGAKGDTGLTGLSIRNTEWVAGVYYRNDTSLTGAERYLDFAIIVGSGDFQDGVGTNYSIYQAKPAHNGVISAANNKPGSGASWGTYWEKINVLKPVFTPILLASLIKASQIDVGSLIVNNVLAQDGDGNTTCSIDGDTGRVSISGSIKRGLIQIGSVDSTITTKGNVFTVNNGTSAKSVAIAVGIGPAYYGTEFTVINGGTGIVTISFAADAPLFLYKGVLYRYVRLRNIGANVELVYSPILDTAFSQGYASVYIIKNKSDFTINADGETLDSI
jgi:hypothetical protein